MEEVIERVISFIDSRKPHYIVTPNVDHIVMLETNEAFQEAYKKADLIICDGMPLVWLSRLLGTPIKERINGTNLFRRVCDVANQKEYSIFLLGGEKDVNKQAAENLKKNFPNIKIAGFESPPFGFENDESYIEKLIIELNNKDIDVLAVCLGAPKQELFMYKYKNVLNIPVSLGIGGTVEFLAGTKRRAPVFIQKCGLEWLFRFIQDPKRLFKRYFIDDLKIINLFFKYKKINSGDAQNGK